MLASAVVLFREVLEIALILSVVLVATRGIPGRNHWAFIGLGAGIIGSALIAFFAEAISSAAEGMGQEIFNAIILLAAALMIGWTVVWMRTHGREIALRMKHVGAAMQTGEAPLYTLSIVVALAIFREGSEIVLFSYGLLASGTDIAHFLFGALTGLIGGIIIGVLFYYGMLKFLAKHFFNFTSALLVFLAAGMASQAVGYLSAAGYVPELGFPIWDTSAYLPDDSLVGETLKVLIGYTAQPSGIQLILYTVTVTVILISMRIFSPARQMAKAAKA